jgi:hypothetical protein
MGLGVICCWWQPLNMNELQLIFHLFIRSQLRYCPVHKTTNSGAALDAERYLAAKHHAM